MKNLQPIRFLLVALALALAALACRHASVVLIGKTTVLWVLAAGAAVVAFRADMADNWMRSTRAAILVVFVHLSGVLSPSRPVFGATVFGILGCLLALGGAMHLAAAARRAAADSERRTDLEVSDIWIMNLAALGVLLVALATLVSDFGVSGLLRAAARALAILAHLGLFLIAASMVRSRRGLAAWAGLALVGIGAALALGGGAALRAHLTVEKGQELARAGKMAEATKAARRATALNRTLRWRGLERRILRLQRDILMARGDTAGALRATARYLDATLADRALTPDDERQVRFAARYMAVEPLQPAIDRYAALEQMRRFIRLHDQLDSMPEECEILHILFLRLGYVDRFSERYDTAGLPPMSHAGSYIEALESLVEDAAQPRTRARARYLLGVVRYASRQFPEAQADFEAVGKIMPDDHNTLVYLERLAMARADKEEAERLRRLPRTVYAGRMTGKNAQSTNVDDTLWTAFESLPGRYHFEAEMRGLPEQRLWPRVSIFVGRGDTPVYSGTVATEEWRSYGFDVQFPDDARSRLLIVFENDLYRERPGRDALNRNLYFRSMRITRP